MQDERSKNSNRSATGPSDQAATQASEQGADVGGSSLLPTISTPRGGGAVRGLGEKFAADPMTGSGTMSLPVAVSPGRSGFGPELQLSYDSSTGNGPFGFGWSLSLPSITRKTDRGLPQYRDAEESDVYLLTGAEDLVPALNADGTRHEDAVSFPGFVVHRYRPRTEGLFSRIERWTEIETGEIRWRTISGDNVAMWFGKDAASRVADPDDPARIFRWLVCESHDDKGNAMAYEYAAEDDRGVDRGRAEEARRVRGAERYLKRIRYGNRVSRLIEPTPADDGWLFEVVFDYDEGRIEEIPALDGVPEDEQHRRVRASAVPTAAWSVRPDPFSSYRAGFEMRTYRRCRRILMFHHFKELRDELHDQPYLVGSTDFDYADFDYAVGGEISVDDELAHQGSTRFASFLRKATQCGYVREEDGAYLKKTVPPVEFEYSKAQISDEIRDLDEQSLENLPEGLDNADYHWVDLDGEGLSGILTEQAGALFYKPNLGGGRFGPLRTLPSKPSGDVVQGRRLVDLAGDGSFDLADFSGPTPGFYERTAEGVWQDFRAFREVPSIDWDDPNLRMVDLNGDGHADILLTEDDAFTWYPSLQEEGFGPALRTVQPWDENAGPRIVLDDGTQSVYLADMSGDGMTDLVRVRNGEICYWPNLGYGRFGAKVTMGDAPLFDRPEQFDQRRIRLADLDGSGTHDLLYLGGDGARAYFNYSGNSWSTARRLPGVPEIDDLTSVWTADLLGDGTACLAWSSALPAEARRSLRYIELMDSKPHLLIKTINNLGSETHVEYAPSTKFYLEDRNAGRPWITRIPFPVHVVERVAGVDRISRNRFVTRYAYHHGHFDGEEREFRGFAMVEQWDTEETAALSEDGALSDSAASNEDPATHVPPVLTKTWFHTGLYEERRRVSNGLADEYFSGGPEDDALLLSDTVLPEGLTAEEEREACRALRGSMLRSEIYWLDGSAKENIPQTVVEENLTVRLVQPRGEQRHGVFFTHPRETLACHYERDPSDPRVRHDLHLEVDDFGNVLREVNVSYGRRSADASLPLDDDRTEQGRTFVVYTQRRTTDAVETKDDHRNPLPCETRVYEATGRRADRRINPRLSDRFTFSQWTENDFALADGLIEIPYEADPDDDREEKRLVDHVRVLYRKDDCTDLLPLGRIESLALPGETYRLAFTSGLLNTVFRRGGQALLPDPGEILSGGGPDRGGYVVDADLQASGHFPAGASGGGDRWWAPSGRMFFSPDAGETAAQELARAREHFFLPRRSRDSFHTPGAPTEGVVDYDAYDLLPTKARDPLGNLTTAGERLPNGAIDPNVPAYDYRVLQPRTVTDANGNRTHLAFDALGRVAATATAGKRGAGQGDALDGLDPNPTRAQVLAALNDPHAALGGATTRMVDDMYAYLRSPDKNEPRPLSVQTLSRETHASDLEDGEQSAVQQSFAYFDGFGREIQRKTRAERGPLEEGGAVVERWASSAWTIVNNKGLPVRRYEPFFSATHEFEARIEGVGSTLFYDPAERVVAVLHPNATYEKTLYGSWLHEAWDVNDTVLSDPATDPDVGGIVAAAQAIGEPTWHAQRIDGSLGNTERDAARKAAGHASTPTTTFFDARGLAFLTLDRHRVVRANHELDGTDEIFAARTEWDIEGHRLKLRDSVVQDGDPRGRVVMRYDYDMIGRPIRLAGIDAGERLMLPDVASNPLRLWDDQGRVTRTEYDPLRRPVGIWVKGSDEADPDRELLIERFVYGEQHPQAEALNLREKLYLLLDQTGVVLNEAEDFKGNPLRTSRRFAIDARGVPDWSATDAALPVDAAASFAAADLEAALVPLVENEAYTRHATYDALDRELTAILPHAASSEPSLIRRRYNVAGLLDGVDVARRGEAWESFVSNIDYDARGEKTAIEYGNGATTRFTFDPDTFRLQSVVTRRAAPNGFETLQNLRYVYDPVGNVTHVQDDAQQTIFFNNRQVDPSGSYAYDSLYRLIEATGREQLRPDGAPSPHSHDDAPRVGLQHPGNGDRLGRYVERYSYDAVGNLRNWTHDLQGANSRWRRTFIYGEASRIEAGKTGNRLSRSEVGGVVEQFFYDAHGNQTFLPHLGGGGIDPNMHWDEQDRLRQVDRGGGGIVDYSYDAEGNRVRKVWRKSAALVEERLYLGEVEIFRVRRGSEILERGTLHVSGDEGETIAMVETRLRDTAGTDTAPARIVRFQFGNHLGSSVLELDDHAKVISYEEYTPYGSTTYQAQRSGVEISKRYRFTQKERDGETGLYYHGARYYAPWLGRWTAIDPLVFEQNEDDEDAPSSTSSPQVNAYLYAFANPVVYVDPDGRENIVAVGAQHDQGRANKLMFVHQGISKLREYQKHEKKESRTMILFKAKYTKKQIKAIGKAVKATGGKLIVVDSVDEFINYVNRKSTKSKSSKLRKQDKVSNLDIFSHGVVGSIEFGYKLEKSIAKKYRFDRTAASKLDPKAFGPDGDQREDRIFSYACRTGLGNKTYTAIGGWDIKRDQSLARSLEKATKFKVKSFIRRTNYSGTLGTRKDRMLWHSERLKKSLARREDIDGADFDPHGAIDPVYVGLTSTPVYLPGRVYMFIHVFQKVRYAPFRLLSPKKKGK